VTRSAAGPHAPAFEDGRHDRRVVLLLAAAATLLYAPTLAYDVTGWDDPEYIRFNPLIRS
jgi:hypothetical protein